MTIASLIEISPLFAFPIMLVVMLGAGAAIFIPIVLAEHFGIGSTFTRQKEEREKEIESLLQTIDPDVKIKL